MIERKHVDEREPMGLLLYTLTTCGWCKKTKALLQELGLGYDDIDVDTLDAAGVEAAGVDIGKWNPELTFPTIVVGGERCMVGFDEDGIRQLAAT